MSDIPIDPTVPNTRPKKKHNRKHKNDKYDKRNLPTPPPDPTEFKEHTESKDKEVLEYLESILPNYSRSTSIFAPVIATEEAFDHLDKLYKLMEQMLELREQNARLHRRIRDLEHFHKLEKLHRELENAANQGGDHPDLYYDAAFAETLLESILGESTKKDQKQTKTPAILRPSILRRNRSGSGTDKQVTLDANVIVEQEDGCEKVDKSSKVSKWTKVKAAFRWEKASTSVGDNKSQDSGIHVPVNVEIVKYLRVPSTSDEMGHSPADSGAAISTPGSLSTASSNEDIRHSENRTPFEDLRSSDDERSQNSYIPHSKEDHISKKLPRTTWAKMKDIIHTRNSFKKKHRLSAASDEIHIDVEFCSDNEDVFEDDPKIKTNPSSSCSSRKNSIPQEVVERYQRALEEDKETNGSRWKRVKKAFLNRETSVEGSSNVQEEIQRNYKKLQKKLSLEFQEKMSEWERLKQNSPGTSSPSPSAFSDENKDPNFMKKMEEWQKIKSQPTPRSPLPSEFDLPPDFKKKLQEWEKIKKSPGASTTKKKLSEVTKWKSLSGNKYEPPTTSSAMDYTTLSDDFKKKLEEWKQIKSSGGVVKLKDKTPSPKLTRKNSSPRNSKKQKDTEKDSQWFEKEICKIEKEKQRLERERHKFLEREERLSKIRRSVVGTNKKEVLIHTPSGFYRFEGISRKFTQKLYEWEKAQGIAPEASTFALLTSSYIPDTGPLIVRHSATPPLLRSKSVDSIAISALNLTCPLLSQQPSSLSLNDMEDMERESLLDSKSSSMQYLLASQEEEGEEDDDDDDDDEPQALLIEVEDYEEETAAPLHTISEKRQLPVYQRQEFKTLCAGETLAAPKIRRSESARAQTNYNLIEDIINVLRHLAENELEIRSISQLEVKQAPENITKLKEFYENQQQFSNKLSEKILKLQEANSAVASSITREDVASHQTHLIEMLEAVQDLSNEVYHMAENMNQAINNRTIENFNTTSTMYLQILESIRDIRSRILELRRHLSYVCAASDTTVPNRKRSGNKKQKSLVCKTISNESKSSRCDTSDTSSRKGSQKEDKHFIKGDNSNLNSSQGAVRKRIKYRQKTMQSKTFVDTDEDEHEDESQRKSVRQHKKLTRAKTFAETETETEECIPELKEEHNLTAKLLVSTGANFATIDVQEESSKTPSESPLTVFVKTTRKLFTPIGEANINVDKKSPSPSAESPKIIIDSEYSQAENNEKNAEDNQIRPQLPPVPPSPIIQRKVFKEISPSIRLMLAKYNQKIEQDTKSNKSGNSSGSNSPIWRSPTSERRVRAQTEKYQEELIKLSPLLGSRKEVQKSASVGYINSGKKQVTLPLRRDSVQEHMMAYSTPISPEREVSVPVNNPSTKPISKKPLEAVRKSLTLDISKTESDPMSKQALDVRQKKLQQAKEEFLKSSPLSAPPTMECDELSFPTRNRLSQISFESESSCDVVLSGSLIKSASVGMINVDADTYRQIDPELHGGGYVSLPRNSTQIKSSKFGFSNIASKFRKVRMRRGKDKDKDKEKPLNTISALCRQSLVVDINKPESANLSNDVAVTKRRASSDDKGEGPSSTSSSRSNSWIRKSLFKK